MMSSGNRDSGLGHQNNKVPFDEAGRPAPNSRGSQRPLNSSHNNHQRLHQPHGVPALGPPSAVAAAPPAPPPPPFMPGESSSPLPPLIQRSLGDRSNEKRKNAALEVEALIKSLAEANNYGTIQAIIQVLSKDFCTSMNANYRKGGLAGLAATATGLQNETAEFLSSLLPSVLHCFDDPDSRVRFYACESLYNMAKVSRRAILSYFNQIFEGLTKLFADVDVDVKNGANLLDRLMKDVVAEADLETFQVGLFLPLLQNYIRRSNPYIRQLIVGWITLLDSLPDISMLDFLPDFLDGLFNMLSDSNREIRQAADSALSDFLRELSASEVLEFGPIINILVLQCQSPERLNRLTAITWLSELTYHPLSGGDALLPFCPNILSAILFCISDQETEIRHVAEGTNNALLQQVKDTEGAFELRPLLETLTKELLQKEDVPTKMAALKWVNMLMEKRTSDMHGFTDLLLPVLLRTLSDPSDPVVLLALRVLSRVSLAVAETSTQEQQATTPTRNKASAQNSNPTTTTTDPKELQFQLVLDSILNLFAEDRQLLETRGSLIIRKLCVLLNGKTVYIRMAQTLASYGTEEEPFDQTSTLQFISTMVQTLNLILLTASELHDLRSILSGVFEGATEDVPVFSTLFLCWCHNPVATYSLCLLARAYDLSFALIQRFSAMEDVSVGFLMQIDKLVHMMESPIFIHLRLQLLNVEAPYHAQLLKSVYGLLMCLPQSDAFRLLNDRLTAVCNLRDNLNASAKPNNKTSRIRDDSNAVNTAELLTHYDRVQLAHREAAAKMASCLEQPSSEQHQRVSTSRSNVSPGGSNNFARLNYSQHSSSGFRP